MKYALITGGSRGIGRAIASALSKDGYYVIINYVSNEAAARETLAQAANGELLRFDVSNREETAAALGQWQATHPQEYIEVLVNNAGIRKDNLLWWMEDDEWDKVIDTNLNSFYNVTKPLLKDMLLHKNGRIINITSLSGVKGLPGQTNYSAAKGGVIAATKALAQEAGRKNVTVNAVAPGFIHTDMTSSLPEAELRKMIPLGRFGGAEEVAALVSFLASDKAAYITGQVININGGLY
ncbi:MAG: 3-oxoacyl-ACP reductase FabG [Bacteroidales bacterium]|jgi:3-oxoacyl-[acyl-carrier protein] reductase|nr:3-oxoacyl-ACP reductase FabG [Bacteroidales bacterium]